ncbi:CDP-alcohol phosphatidyltransferase family protein [Anaeromyxobacter dehalogenans]|uniref:CDP-diacylglycerol--glycerol-3-phosphate 3-phosphatidyltransferase n=1 Tax=Anaeromyxobacter dehalogenans (strain 2CP-C) TaxID=290397 RepID=Q2IJC7_ANADE|nr:CDP-alcohol phosphatidyltransferase family protein [Anaeromyxobacter dehalogenans]ABC81754.1 CDP-alcohol phosphatidyltransferase [Anaeromyxobacter dehalogenans 2CP-C]
MSVPPPRPLEDEPRPAEDEASPVNLANALTALRIALAPAFLVLYVGGDRPRALAAFAAAAATDVLDGLVARALRQRTRLGAFLDPIADKFLAACALVALAATGRLPAWLPALVVARDLAQLAGAAFLRTVHRVIPVAPTRIGKYATFALAATVLTALAGDYGGYPRHAVEPYVAALGLLAALCVTLSFAQYFLFFLRAARAPGR